MLCKKAKQYKGDSECLAVCWSGKASILGGFPRIAFFQRFIWRKGRCSQKDSKPSRIELLSQNVVSLGNIQVNHRKLWSINCTAEMVPLWGRIWPFVACVIWPLAEVAWHGLWKRHLYLFEVNYLYKKEVALSSYPANISSWRWIYQPIKGIWVALQQSSLTYLGKRWEHKGKKIAKPFQGETAVISENLGWNFMQDSEIETYLAWGIIPYLL